MLRLRLLLVVSAFLFVSLSHGQSNPENNPPEKKSKSEEFLEKWFVGPAIDPQKLPLKIDTGALDLREPKGESKERVWIASKGVHLWQELKGEVVLDVRCKQAVIWLEEQDKKQQESQENSQQEVPPKIKIYAEGNVFLRWGRELLKGERVFFDLENNRGIILDAKIHTDVLLAEEKTTALQIGAKRLLLRSKDHMSAQNTMITTCRYGEPQYHFASKDVEIVRVREKLYLESRDNSLYVGDTPFFYIPYFSGETIENFPLKSISYGNSSRFGQHLLTLWGGTLYESTEERGRLLGAVDEINWFLDFDIYQDRGLGVGPGITYEGDTGEATPFLGRLSTYYVYDRPLKDFGSGEDDQEEIELGDPTFENLFRVYFLHRHSLPAGWRLDAELSKISDRELLFDFFEDEARDAKEQETYIHLKRIWSNQGATFLVRYNLNDFVDQVNQLPQATYHLIQQPILTNSIPSLYFSSDVELAYLERDDNVNISVFDNERSFRADWNNTLTHRLFLGPINVVSFLSGRGTYFEKEFEGDHNVVRGVLSSGVEVSTNFHRTFQVQNQLLDINGLQHIFTPRLSYRWVETSSDPDNFIQFDEVDTIADFNEVRLRLINRLKTVRGGLIDDFLYSELDLSYFPDRGGDFVDKLSNLEMDLIFRVGQFSLSSNTEYNFAIGDLEVLSTTVGYIPRPWLKTSVDFRYLREENFITTFTLDYKISSKWEFGLRSQYDFRNEESRENQVVFRRILPCRFALDIIFEVDEVDDEAAVSVSLVPLDFGGEDRFANTNYNSSHSSFEQQQREQNNPYYDSRR